MSCGNALGVGAGTRGGAAAVAVNGDVTGGVTTPARDVGRGTTRPPDGFGFTVAEAASGGAFEDGVDVDVGVDRGPAGVAGAEVRTGTTDAAAPTAD